MNCPKCGSEISENQKFCSSCGANLTNEQNNINPLNSTNKLLFPIIGGACVIALIFAGIGYSMKPSTNITDVQPTETEENIEDDGNAFDPEIAKKMTKREHNCVYVSSDGICFTTKIFKAEPIKDFNKIDKYNYWLGAKDACESKGYRLPNDKELRSLFSDIIGIKVNSGIDVKSEKYSDSNIPTNFGILKKIAPKQEHDNIYLWENETFDEDRALARSKGNSWNSDETHQYIADKFGYKNIYYKESTICVYDQNGKPHKSLLETTKEKELQLKQQEEQRKKEEQRQKQEQMDNEAENTLF